jgi:hypothetical protein
MLVDQARPAAKPQVTAIPSYSPGGLEPDDDDYGVPRRQFFLPFAQLREMLFSEQSAEITQKDQDHPAPAQVVECHHLALGRWEHKVRSRITNPHERPLSRLLASSHVPSYLREEVPGTECPEHSLASLHRRATRGQAEQYERSPTASGADARARSAAADRSPKDYLTLQLYRPARR